jgi:hypothetical protein
MMRVVATNGARALLELQLRQANGLSHLLSGFGTAGSIEVSLSFSYCSGITPTTLINCFSGEE